MPLRASSRSRQLVIGGLSVSQIQNFIPRIWKTQHSVENPTRLNDAINNESKSSIMSSYCPVTSLRNLAKRGRLSDAFKSFSRTIIGAGGATYDDVVQSIYALSISCTNLKCLPGGRQLHAQVVTLGIEQNSSVVARLVSFYSCFGMFSDAHFLVRRCGSLGVLESLPWNVLISSYVKRGLFRKGIDAYKEMVGEGIEPDRFTFPCVLKACGEESDLKFGKEVHRSIVERGSNDGWSLFVHNALIAMYAKFGELGVARQLFDEMPERDLVSWNTIISAYASRGVWKEAFVLFENMRMEGVEASIIIWNTIAGGLLRSCNFWGALELLTQMTSCGIRFDSVAMIIGLSACSHTGAIRLGKEIHAASIRSYFDGVNNVRNALITMYSRCKNLHHATILFRRGEAKSISTWNAMISGYSHIDQSEEASSVFREMLASKVEPNYVTIASILPLCARVANLQHGKEFHCYIMRREGFKDNLLLWNALIDMYARSGKFLEAKRLFDNMSRRDEVTYTSLIAGYGIQGEGRAALALFEEMIDAGIKPDHVTMVAVLSACSHSRLVTQGQLLFDKMGAVYGLSPHLQHYACLVDLYGRAGLLNKAKVIILGMPFRPTADIWATLLGACRIHGNTEIGEWAAEKLLELKPKNPGYYVLIANIYAAAGCWDKLAQVRTFMRDMGVGKDPGCAWVDVGAGFSPFLVEDTSNPHSDDIYPALEGLAELMKHSSYVLAEELGIDNEAVEGKLMEAG